jgi:UDP-N-acetylmuramyl tripeptide synthase
VKVFLAVLICKVLYFIGKQIGRGSSLPGKAVLRIFPDILEKLKLPDIVIAVTGSNGKTSTSELIAHALEKSGMSVGWNHEGSNQTEGIATLLLRIASLGGRVKRDAIVMECDERYAVRIFKKIKPSILLVTNLCRDQLTRNGHTEFVADCVRASIITAGSGTKLVLNADDPYVAALIASPEVTVGEVLWFSPGFKSCVTPHIGLYDDGAFCPVCKSRMTYTYRIAGHYGDYNCASCGFKRKKPEVEAGNTGLNADVELALTSITNTYNLCAAIAALSASGISLSDSMLALDGYKLTGGRTVELPIENRKGLLLVSKHENSFAYNSSLFWIKEQQKPCTVIVLVDTISRKYYTSETSWLWDVDFDLLADENVRKIVLAGSYVNELAARFVLSSVDQGKIGYVAELSGLREYIDNNTGGDIYAVTCFADKAKLLNALK